ncbi:sulfotransferase family protein [Coleofasciculus sp.]|uniref:sulfotransferase family protein n=1 Tax=Coleofasciculus sp. TaxID=3100458 RepID=UPI0039F860CF
MSVEKPIFILGAPRSGTTWLGKAFDQHPDLACWAEISNIWMWGNTHKTDDQLTDKDLNPPIKRYIQKRFAEYLEKYHKKRICDKTPRNCLRISFIQAVFPDAKIIMLLRDGRSVINSTKKELNRPKNVPWKEAYSRLKEVPVWEWSVFLPRITSRLKRMVGIPLDYWGARPPGWQEWVNQYSREALLAKQWSETMEIAIAEGRKLPPENYLEIRYEDLVSSPQDKIHEIAHFAELDSPEPIINYAMATADPSRTNKWKDSLDPNILQEIKEIMEPTMSKLGYPW